MTYEEHHAVLVAYLKSKVEIGDWRLARRMGFRDGPSRPRGSA